MRNFVYTTRPFFNKKLGWDRTVIYLGYLLGWGLGNFVNTRPLFNKKLGWDITVIYLRDLFGWEVGKFCIYNMTFL